MIRVGIVADDLTGAGDTAVQFVRAGWTTELQLHPGNSTAAVVAVTTDTRGRNGPDAAASVATAVGRLRDSGMTHLYKKIDSTLRGNVRHEVQAAVRQWSPRAVAVVCPAFPAAGRTVIDGELRVNGTPIGPSADGHIPTLLGALHVCLRSHESSRELSDRLKANAPVVVVDAADDRDLRRLAEAIALTGPDAIAVGSAGLARHLAVVWAAERAAPPALVIVTSQHEAAQRQAEEIARAGAHVCRPSADDVADDAAWERWKAGVFTGVQRVDAIMLNAPAERRQDFPQALIPARFAELAARVVERIQISGVVVTGGDGARALADAFQATAIDLRDEIASGVPMGVLVGGSAPGLRIVTKAGGFGTDETLLLAVEAIRYRRLP